MSGGLPWLILINGIIFAVVGGIACASALDAARNAARPYVFRVISRIGAVMALIGFVLFVSAFWVGTIGFGWFS